MLAILMPAWQFDWGGDGSPWPLKALECGVGGGMYGAGDVIGATSRTVALVRKFERYTEGFLEPSISSGER